MDAAEYEDDRNSPDDSGPIPTIGSKLEAQIKLVRDLRKLRADVRTEFEKEMATFNKEHVDLMQAMKEAQEDLTEEEAQLRNLTLLAYTATGSKKPAEGVGIRIVKKIEFNPDDAFKWATDHDLCLRLDEHDYSTGLKSGLFKDMPGRVFEEPQATISKDL